MKLSFYGGVGKVTGSNFLIEGERGKMLVDCGLEQGSDFSEKSAYDPFPYDVKKIDALVLTHAHLDHCGRVPRLVREGFRGKIYMTPPTRALAELILRDSVDILAEDAKRRGMPLLYEEKDVDELFSLVETLDYHTEKEIPACRPAGPTGLSVYLRTTGHILGSASVRIKDEGGNTVALSGDIGNSPSPLLPDWEPVDDADVLVMESTYGDRLHPEQNERTSRLREALRRAEARSGAILIPAFSLERTQLMLYELSNFFEAGDLPKIPVFLDSPLAIHVTDVYEKMASYFKPETEDEMKREGSVFDFPFLKKTLSREESAEIEKTPNPKIIIAGAGMSHGGRIGRWESKYLPDPSTTLFIVGYQAPGSPGRRIAEGSSSVRLNDREVPIRAKIELLDGWSAHADRDQLLKFASCSAKATQDTGSRLKTVFCAMGEPSAQRFLAQRIHDYLGVRAIAPEKGQTWEITKSSVKKIFRTR